MFDFTSPQVFWHLWKLKMQVILIAVMELFLEEQLHAEKNMVLHLKSPLKDALLDLNIPVIYDMDFGHRPPQIAMLNGGFLKLNIRMEKVQLNIIINKIKKAKKSKNYLQNKKYVIIYLCCLRTVKPIKISKKY